nr:Fic family protein [Lentibacillus sp. CBA3610]
MICESHITFERIHPFADGNGRVGRLIINYLLIKNAIAPLIIEKDEKERYIYFLATQETEGFTKFVEQKVETEQKRLDTFKINKQKTEN